MVVLSKSGEELVDPPGRDLLLSGGHTFADLAGAIDGAFARWDRSHLHEFRLADGRRVVMAENADEVEGIDPTRDLDERLQSLGSAGLRAGDVFTYLFDLGDDWQHRCSVLRTDVDHGGEYGAVPKEIVPVFGWGTSRTSTGA